MNNTMKMVIQRFLPNLRDLVLISVAKFAICVYNSGKIWTKIFIKYLILLQNYKTLFRVESINH